MTSTVAPMGTLRADPVWRDRVVLVLAYGLAWGALLVNRGLFWDDWTLVGRSVAELVDGYAELGVPWAGYFYAVLLALPLPGLVGHVLVFCAYLLSTLVLHAILLRIPGLSRLDAVVAALTFALFPVNFARIALIDLPYGLSLLEFLTATWLLIGHVQDGGLIRRLTALALFAASFSTASLLVLYVVPLAIGAYVARQSGRMPLPHFVMRHLDFVVLPVAYWVLKAALLPASGVYEGYNALTLRGLARVPQAMVSVPDQVLLEPVGRAVMVGGLAGLVVGIVVAVWLVRRSRAVEDGDFVSPAVLALVGVVLLGLGVFAYLAVGRTPSVWDWSSRHQLLVPLGAGLLVAAAARGIQGAGRAGPAVALVVGILLGVSLVADARTLVAYQADWFKQAALIETARGIPELQTARHIRMVDDATAFNAMRRRYRFYEYNALLSVAVGGTGRLASDGTDEPSPEEIDQFISRPAYRMGEYVPSPVDLELQVSAGEELPGPFELLWLLGLEAVGSRSFETEVSRLIDVQVTPVVGSVVVLSRGS